MGYRRMYSVSAIVSTSMLLSSYVSIFLTIYGTMLALQHESLSDFFGVHLLCLHFVFSHILP
jgi:hypothetical protein